MASWYGPDFHGLRTATGEPYDMFAMTAAHKTLPLPCYARVTNLSNGRSVVVRINDRGPFVANRIIDLSYTAAARLDMIRNGTAFVQVEVLSPAEPADPARAAGHHAGAHRPPASASAACRRSARPPATAAASSTAAAAARTAAAAPPAAAAGRPRGRTVRHLLHSGRRLRAGRERAARRSAKLRAAGLEHVFTLAPRPISRCSACASGPIESVQQFDALIARLTALGFPDARLAQD